MKVESPLLYVVLEKHGYQNPTVVGSESLHLRQTSEVHVRLRLGERTMGDMQCTSQMPHIPSPVPFWVSVPTSSSPQTSH